MAIRDTYTKVHEEWKNLPDETTPVFAEDLEHFEQGIKNAMDNRALKEIYGDTSINLGRIAGMNVGEGSATAGYYLTASGNYSFSEGFGTIVSGNNSHGEGNGVVVSGNNSHGEGRGTRAIGDNQHVSGKYNVEDANKAAIVGGGESYAKKNIYTLDWQGNAVYAGDVTNGAGVSLNSLKSAIDNMEIIAEGGSIAKVFETKAELDAWLLVEGNTETLTVGQNIYIVETGTPDYWWDGTGLQPLETDKVEIESMTYEETMAVLNASVEEAS